MAQTILYYPIINIQDGACPMKQFILLEKQSKKVRRAYHAKQRGSWCALFPVTRTVPNGKASDRDHVKRENKED